MDEKAVVYGDTTAIGVGAAAIGYRALALGQDGVAINCQCGLELTGRAAPGKAAATVLLFYRIHAESCPLAAKLLAEMETGKG